MPAGSTYSTIATTTLGSAQANVTFSSFSGYTDLELVCNYGLATAGNTLAIQVNSDTGTNYSWTWVFGDGSSATSARSSNTSSIPLISLLGSENALTTQVNVKFQNYANTTTNKTLLARGGRANANNYPGSGALVGLWRSTSAITSIKLFDPNASNIISGSTFTLYGIASA